MASGSRTPPRFVPTLTVVAGQPASGPAPEAADAVPAPEASAATAGPVASLLPEAPLSTIAVDPATRLDDAAAFELEEQLLHRVLQRVDLSLEERLSDVVAASVQRQLDEMVPALRTEIEAVLRSLVVEALAQELSESTGSVPASGPRALG